MLRDRLQALHRDALTRLAQAGRIDAGLLELVAHAGAVIAALDAAAGAIAEPGDRALIVDDNATLRIVVFSTDRQAACATLSPVAAIKLGNQLVAAGVRRL